MTSNYKIDWYSFSFWKPHYDYWHEPAYENLMAHLEDTSPDAHTIFQMFDLERGNGRPPFNFYAGSPYFKLWANNGLDYALYEVTGKGCEFLQYHDGFVDVFQQTHDRCTRIDLCVDFETGVTNMVDDFISAGYSDRFKSISSVKSSAGQTFYIGSRKSERMCRVYQYNEPHPRSNNLRIEFELKDKRAKQVAGLLADGVDLRDVIISTGNAYSFEHIFWKSFCDGSIGESLPPIKGKQSSNATLAWLLRQCVPAFKRLVKEGIITEPVQFLVDNFLDPEPDDFPF